MLVAQGVVTAEVVRDVLAIKIRETLLDVFLWDAGLFRLETDWSDDAEALGARVELSEIGREAEFRATAWSAFRSAFPSGAATLAIHEERIPADLLPATVDGRLLALARAGRTIDELALALHMPDFHLYQRLFALQKRGLLDAAPRGGGDLGVGELIERARTFLAGGGPTTPTPSRGGGWSSRRATRARARRSPRRSGPSPPASRHGSSSGRCRPGWRSGRGALARLQASAIDKYVLSRCDGSRTVRQLVQVLPLRRLDVLRTIQRFTDAGSVVLMAQPGGPERTT